MYLMTKSLLYALRNKFGHDIVMLNQRLQIDYRIISQLFGILFKPF